jgi:type I restriction enzyme M protein
MNNSPNLVTLKDASKILNVSSETLRNWDKQGKLKASRHPVNQYRLYDLDAIQSLNNVSTVAENAVSYLTLFDDGSSLKSAVKSMSKAFRDSQGGSMLERFEEISKLLFCKLYDEQHHKGKTFSSISRALTDDKIFEVVSNLFKSAKQDYPNVFVNGRAEFSEDIKAISQVALILQHYELTKIRTDIKGKIYEELIKNTFDKNENQQFFTPRNIVDFIMEIVSPQPHEKICDPACGSGGFLIAALEYINKKHPSVNLENYCRENLIGAEIDSRMVWIAQMNLILHGGHHSSMNYLKGGGSLSFSKEVEATLPDNSIDIIVTNPPFGSDYDLKSDLENFELGRGKKSRRRGILFVERCIKMLKPNGRLVIVIEESILNNNSNEDVRHFITKNTIVEAIISLPDTTFMPYATVKTSVLVLRKKDAVHAIQNDILMCNVEQIGYAPNGDPLYSDDRDAYGKLKLLSDLPKTIDFWQQFNHKGKIENNEQFFTIKPSIKELNQRLDTLFYHPAKQIAFDLLAKSKYPLHRLGEIVSVINRMIIPQFEYPDDLVRYIGLANIKPFECTYFVSEILGEKIKSAVKAFEPNTVIFSKLRPELRKVVYINQDEEQGFASSECYIFKANTKILPQYLAIMLRSDLVYGQIIFQVTGLGRPRIGKNELLSVKIPLPPIEKQKEIVNMIATCESNKQSLLEKSRLLQNQADNLLKKGFEDIETTLRL